MIYTLDLLPAAEAARTTLRIALLGPPMLMWGGQPVAMARRQARALLYRIAAAAQPVAREQLAFLLWPDSPEATARRNLTVLLTQIRRALPSPDLLVTVGDAIGLNCEAAETDTAALATLIAQATGAGRLDLLANALLRYRGPFLDGFALPDSAEFDAWASQERQAWERRYLDALAVLVEGYAFEHLLSAAVPVADLVAAAPGLRILATSRSVLNLSGEQILPVPPLPLPDLERLPPPPELATQPAVALLLARARAHTPAFQLNATNAADLAAICVHLDGLPLAIELAAARLKALSPQALLKRLDHRLSVLDRGPRDLPDRQRTLRAAIEWSYRLLDLHLQRLFERLAAFAGGWTLEAAEAICGSWGMGVGSSKLLLPLSLNSHPLFWMGSWKRLNPGLQRCCAEKRLCRIPGAGVCGRMPATWRTAAVFQPKRQTWRGSPPTTLRRSPKIERWPYASSAWQRCKPMISPVRGRTSNERWRLRRITGCASRSPQRNSISVCCSCNQVTQTVRAFQAVKTPLQQQISFAVRLVTFIVALKGRQKWRQPRDTNRVSCVSEHTTFTLCERPKGRASK